LSPLEIGFVYSLSALAHLVAIPLGGYLVNAWGSDRVTMVFMVALVGLLTTVWLIESQTVFLACFMSIGAVQAVLSASSVNMAVSAVPENRLGPSIGIQRSVGDTALILAPLTLGLLKDVFDLDAQT